MPFDGTKTSPLLTVLIEGRRRIEESWFQSAPGTSMPIDGHCAVFAISRQNVGALTVDVIEALNIAIFGSMVGDSGNIVRWNDDPVRTKEDVLAAYDRAIETVIAG